MPRSHRIDVANGLHHVTQRGLDRRNIVLDDDDRSHGWRLFERVARRCRWRVFAVALLDNHFHLYLTGWPCVIGNATLGVPQFV